MMNIYPLNGDKLHQWHQHPDLFNLPTTVAKNAKSPDIRNRVDI